MSRVIARTPGQGRIETDMARDKQTPDDVSLFRRSWALRCIIIPARAASTDIGGRPRPAGGCTTGGSGALAFCVTV